MTDQLRIEPNPKWIRGMAAGQVVADSRGVLNVWEHEYFPAWYFPIGDVAAVLEATGETFGSDLRGAGTRFNLIVDGLTVSDAAWQHLDSPVEELRDKVRIEWNALDTWFEEDVEVFVHPRSPNVRVDALASSRRIQVSLNGTELADSSRATVLYETGLPPRYYLPKSDVRMDLLTPTDTETACPYKGWASYWSVKAGGTEHPDLAWGYRTPLPESGAVAGLVCFYNEKVDIEVT